jgi:deoxycytidylate deaminase
MKRELTEKDIEIYYFLMQLKEKSECIDKQVACIIVDENYNIVSQGVNIIQECDKNCYDKVNRICNVKHAEEVAIENLCLFNQGNRKLKAYISLCPCVACQKILGPYVEEIIYFGMTHKDILKRFKNKIINFPHLHYKIHSSSFDNETLENVKNAFKTLVNCMDEPDEQHVIHAIIQAEVQLEQLKMLMYESDSEFHNNLRTIRNHICKAILQYKYMGER